MEKKNEILDKLKEKSLKGEDLSIFFELLLWYTKQSLYAEDELYGWDKHLQFVFSDAQNFHLSTINTFSEHPELVLKYDKANSPSTTITTNAEFLMGIICGRIKYSKMTANNFKVEGDYMQFQFFLILYSMMLKELI